jgi:hypothetical protein
LILKLTEEQADILYDFLNNTEVVKDYGYNGNTGKAKGSGYSYPWEDVNETLTEIFWLLKEAKDNGSKTC